MLNTVIHNYRITRELGSGGMAAVWQAEHVHLKGRAAAIKLLHPALSMHEYVRRKFYDEAQVLAGLSHEGIVNVRDFGEHNGSLYLIMDYVEGRTLEGLIDKETGPIPHERAVALFRRILAAVGYAHRHSIVHRDLKPANVIITPADKAVVIDFGIVKILEQEDQPGKTGVGTQIGTPSYMSPEQVMGDAVDQRTDVYSLGVLLYQMITGRPAYESSLSTYRIHNSVVNEPLPRIAQYYPHAPAWLQGIVDKATEKRKEDRFQSCEDFSDALLKQQAPTDSSPSGADHAVIHYFIAQPDSIRLGDLAVLRWKVSGVDKISITGLGSTATLDGMHTVRPGMSTKYVLQAGGKEETVEVVVEQKAAAGGVSWSIVVAAIIDLLIGGGSLIGMLANSSEVAYQDAAYQFGYWLGISAVCGCFIAGAIGLLNLKVWAWKLLFAVHNSLAVGILISALFHRDDVIAGIMVFVLFTIPVILLHLTATQKPIGIQPRHYRLPLIIAGVIGALVLIGNLS